MLRHKLSAKYSSQHSSSHCYFTAFDSDHRDSDEFDTRDVCNAILLIFFLRYIVRSCVMNFFPVEDCVRVIASNYSIHTISYNNIKKSKNIAKLSS